MPDTTTTTKPRCKAMDPNDQGMRCTLPLGHDGPHDADDDCRACASTHASTTNKASTAAVVTYAASIVTANLLVAEYGPSVTVWNALVLIGLDLVLRDYLHDAWHAHRIRNMAALIVGTGIVSYVANPATGRIAVASCIAFAAAATVDWAVYASAARRPWLERSNASNVAGAAVDSLLFPTIAFGAVLWPIVLGQFLAKTIGGAAWSLLIAGGRRVVAHHH